MQERPAPTITTVAAIGGTGGAAVPRALWCVPVFAAPSVLTAPRVETILREIFDESVPEDHEAAAATPISSPHAASLAELTAPGLREKSRNIDDAEIREDKRAVSGVNTRVPGVSEDDLSRYRRQMFRTDI